MKKNFLTALLFVGAIAWGMAQDNLSIKDMADGKYAAEGVYGVTPMNDGDTFTRLSSDGKRIERCSFKTGKAVGTLFDVSKARGEAKLNRIDGYIMSPDETKILLQTQTKQIFRHTRIATYLLFSVENNKFETITDGTMESPKFSPDGNYIAFVRDNNLFLIKLLFGNSQSQITQDGKRNEIINGLPDWVNEEEFTTARSFDFSADSKMLAWVRYDERKVSTMSIPMYKGMNPAHKEYDEYPGAFEYKYPVAGSDNSVVSVHTFDIKSRVTRKVQLPLDVDGHVPRIKFTSDPEKLAIVTLNRHQDRMDIYMANPRSTICKLVVREQSDKYVKESAYETLSFYKNHFAFVSDRSGYRHLYWYTLNGQLEKQITSGKFEVTDFYGADEALGKFYYASSKESPLKRAVYVTDLKGKTQKLSISAGTNSAIFSKSFKYYLNNYSSATVPPVYTLCDGDGKVLSTLVDNKKLKTQLDGKLGTKEFFSFKTSEGVELNGWMIKPRNFDSSKKYPVIMYQYSGPGSQNVADSWNGIGFMAGGTFESYMADKGFIMVCVDGRGTGFRGADFEKCTYLRLGEKESKDQVEVALYLSSLSYVDKSKIGIWGWSFGGFNTLMSMSEGRPVFRAGVAVAAPSNWKFYDTVYTERYMRTPNENADGYAINPIQRVKNIHGDLLLVHGSADDNVHLRNAMEYSEALVQAGVQFREQIYTNRNHGIYGGKTREHLFTLISNFFFEKLK